MSSAEFQEKDCERISNVRKMPYYYILNSIESILKCFKYRQVSVKCLSNCRQTYVKLREVGLNLVNRGMKVESFAALIRLREILEEKE